MADLHRGLSKRRAVVSTTFQPAAAQANRSIDSTFEPIQTRTVTAWVTGDGLDYPGPRSASGAGFRLRSWDLRNARAWWRRLSRI